MDVDVLKKNGNGEGLELPSGKDRLFRGADYGSTEIFNIFSPEIRDTSLYHGLDQLLKRIEFNCSIAYGTLSDPQSVDRTATEVISSKHRSYSMVKDIQKSLQGALEDLVYGMNAFAALYGLPNTTKYEVSFNWDDSIIIDKETELASMRSDVASSLLRPEIYLAKKYGVTEKEALALMPDAEESLKEGLPVSRR